MAFKSWVASAAAFVLVGLVSAAALPLEKVSDRARLFKATVTQNLSQEASSVCENASRRTSGEVIRVRNITVANSQELYAALKSARSGDVIDLAPGDYGSIRLQNLKFPGEVTVRSLDPSNKAVLSGLDVRNSAGLTFQGLEFDLTGQPGNAIKFTASERLSLDRSWIHGSLDDDPSGDPPAMLVRDSKHITVSHSEFEQLWGGIGFLGGSHYTFIANTFHDMRSDGIRGGGASFVNVKNNYFTDFYPIPGDHPDAIQFWTLNTTASATDIVVSGNVYIRGEGRPIQGIFLKAELKKYPYHNVTISDNLLVGGLWNGIALDRAVDSEIVGNTLVALEGQNSRIRVSSDVVLRDNAAPQVLVDEKSVSTDRSMVANDGGASALQKWWASVGSKLQDLPSSLLEVLGVTTVGQGPTAPDATPSVPTPEVVVVESCYSVGEREVGGRESSPASTLTNGAPAEGPSAAWAPPGPGRVVDVANSADQSDGQTATSPAGDSAAGRLAEESGRDTTTNAPDANSAVEMVEASPPTESRPQMPVAVAEFGAAVVNAAEAGFEPVHSRNRAVNDLVELAFLREDRAAAEGSPMVHRDAAEFLSIGDGFWFLGRPFVESAF